MSLLSTFLPKAVLAKILTSWLGKQTSTNTCAAAKPYQLKASQVWSYSPNENEEWLCLRRLTTDGNPEIKTQDIRSPIPDKSCRLLAAADVSVAFRYPD